MAALQVAEPRRLVISEMELENFKSYAGVQRVGPFHKVCAPGSALDSAANPASTQLPHCCNMRKPHKQASLAAPAAELLVRGGPQRQRQVQRDRRHALCVRETCQAGAEGLCAALRPHSQRVCSM